jgi:hypothetical protein
VLIAPVIDHVPVLGSYNSALDVGAAQHPLRSVSPPATSTLPLGSKVAVWSYRWTDIGPVGEKEAPFPN